MSDKTITIVVLSWAIFVLIFDLIYGREKLRKQLKYLYTIRLYKVIHPIRTYKLRKIIRQIIAENDELLIRLDDNV